MNLRRLDLNHQEIESDENSDDIECDIPEDMSQDVDDHLQDKMLNHESINNSSNPS